MSWYTLEDTDKPSTWAIKIKWWHPGFLLEGYRTLRTGGCGVLASIWFTLVLAYAIAKR